MRNKLETYQTYHNWYLIMVGWCNKKGLDFGASPPNHENICVALRDLVPCGQFKKREKHPWRSVAFSKVAS